MTQTAIWRTDAPVTSELYDRQKDRLESLTKTISGLEAEGVYVKDITVYVDGVEWELSRLGDRDFGTR